MPKSGIARSHVKSMVFVCFVFDTKSLTVRLGLLVTEPQGSTCLYLLSAETMHGLA